MVLVLGCGRTGTNLLTSMIAGSSVLELDPQFENRNIFNVPKKYGKNYLCKSDVTYLTDYSQLKRLIEQNNTKIVFTIRDPRDVMMSKIRRGQPKSMGGDNSSERTHDDATPSTSIESLLKAYETYDRCSKDYPNSVLLIKMEDTISHPVETCERISDFLNISYEDEMVNFGNRVANKYKKERYGTKIDNNQVCLWRDWRNVYDGFFTKSGLDMDKHFESVDHLVEYFKYDKI
jgi:hypothetical protein